MISFIVTFLFQLLSLILTAGTAFAQQTENLTFGQKSEQKPVAVLIEIRGDVRTKSAASLNWIEARDQQPLFVGDLVFSGTNGKARIEYTGIGANVMIGSNSLATVRRMPPSLSRFRRSFGADRGRKGEKGSAKAGERAITPSQPQSPQPMQAAVPVFDVGLMLSRDVDLIPLLFPIGKVYLHARRFPTWLPVKLDKTWDAVGLWAFLWRVDDDLKPVWSGFSRGSFAGIPIPRKGIYKLQIVSEDEVRTTSPITIRATQGAALALAEWPAGSAEDPSTVVFQ